MNKAKLKRYAPQARKDFIAAVEARANLLGLSDKGGMLDVTPSEKKGDVALICGQAWPAKVHDQRERLIKRIRKDGYAQTLEAVAYTWFNRFAALRYMEIHDYLGHGYRALSSREGGLPEILTHATEVAGVLPGLNAAQVAEMKLAGNKDGELYRLLLVAQCNALSSAMPFLFECIDDESELLLPGNLERTDSVIAKLVCAIEEEDWNEVEVIGWLYQFYISEKKEEVIGKVVKSEDIPAATQLFTPNWIVQYLIQNSVGRLWLMANPASTLKSQWPYYIEPAEQTPEVQAQLDALIQIRTAEDGGSLNPESITVLDPACGSGHILAEAYEVLKAIYLERGYPARSIPRLILEKNLYGLDIDDRAAQMAGFALMMKARADDRRLLDSPLNLNVLALQESKGLDLDEFAEHLKPFGISRNVLGQLFDIFEHAKTFGSLIEIPEALDREFIGMVAGLNKADQTGDVFAQAAARDLVPLVAQAAILAMKFDAVVANPPYMGGKGMNGTLKAFVKERFSDANTDLYASFMGRGCGLVRDRGFVAMITMHGWMYQSTLENFRRNLLANMTLQSVAHFGARAFAEISGEVVQSCAQVLQKIQITKNIPVCFRLTDGDETVKQHRLKNKELRIARYSQEQYLALVGSPVAYWLEPETMVFLGMEKRLHHVGYFKKGCDTGKNEDFLRLWHEVSRENVALPIDYTLGNNTRKWLPYSKGGGYRRWYGNQEFVVNWENDGAEIRQRSNSTIRNEQFFFREGCAWSDVATGLFSLRKFPSGFIMDASGPMAFFDSWKDELGVLAFCNSTLFQTYLNVVMQGFHYSAGVLAEGPYDPTLITQECLGENVRRAVDLSKSDWDAYEVSWDFERSPIVALVSEGARTIESCFSAWKLNNCDAVAEIKRIEEENNRLFIDAYGLADELTPDVPVKQISLTGNIAYRYGGNLGEEEQWARFRQDTMVDLISYAIGCMMGRYSLDEPGLIYANAVNVGFDASRYKTFPADADGIVPITDELWFEDDATNCVRGFLRVVWGAQTLDENMAWLAESLGKKASETPEETIRRYLSGSFFKDHLQTYKKRPIYWLFSSGKQGAFQALVYLHRYHEGTLARMRAEYVVPLTGKMQSRIERLEKDRDAASSTAARNKIAKQIESLKKKHVELLAYDEKLRHYADMRINLDLDDGVKVNYGKFGDLLAEVKAVTGGAGDE